MTVNIIYGSAGTGKTSELANRIINSITTNFVVLAPTHSAVNTIFNATILTGSKIGLDVTKFRTNFKTIHSFFRINYITNKILGPSKKISNIFIDELSMINKQTFKKCFSFISDSNITIAGDPMQLTNITKDSISFNKMDLIQEYMNKISSKILRHITGTIIVSKLLKGGEITHLTINHRSNSNIIKLIDNIYSNIKFQIPWIEFDDIINKINDEQYIFIASKWNTLQIIYDSISFKTNKFNIHITQKNNLTLHLYSGLQIVCGETTDSYFNGERVTFIEQNTDDTLTCINDKGENILIRQFNGEYPIIPWFLSTIHKSQGKTIKNVILCVDDLFLISMMYTGITRASDNILFYSNAPNREETFWSNAYVDDFNSTKEYINFILSKNK
jgi:thymidine kinase